MTTTKTHDGHGGSYVVGEDEVKKREGTMNPGDPGYAERVKREPVADREKPGTLNRVPSFRDLEQKPAKPKEATKAPAPAGAPANPEPKGGK